MNYRLIYTGLGLGFVAVIALGIALGSVQGEPNPLPVAVEAVSPRPGDTVQRQASIEVIMQPGYDVEFFVDGVRIPDVEVVVVGATGVHSWQPGLGRLFEEWSRGEHTVRILWNTTTGVTDTGDFEWTFRSF